MKNKILSILMFVLIFLVAGIGTASAVDLSPILVTTPSNDTTVTSGTLAFVAVATDAGDNKGIKYIDIYEDGQPNGHKDCNSAVTCTYTKAFSHNGDSHLYYAKTEDLGGHVKTSNQINVTFNSLPEQPTLDIPDNYTVQEDSGMNNDIFDLHNYADDPDTPITSLTFSIAQQSNSTLADCSIDSNRYVDCDVVLANASGTSDVTIYVSDGVWTTVNDTFTLIVEEVNDAP